MVPLIVTSDFALSAALRKRIAESCQRDLTKAFVAWLLEHPADLLSIAACAAKREGAGQDFQTVAILGFAADGGVLSQRELAALKKGLSRLAGRSPVVSGVPMPFCADAVGLLGIALGTAVLANAEVSGQVAGWAMRFLKSAYDRDRAEDWQRCLFAAADLKLGTPLKLSFPNSAAAADVRAALMAKGLINCPDVQVRQDAERILQITTQEALDDVDCERAALRLAGVEWVIRRGGNPSFRAGGFSDHIITTPPDTSKDDKQTDIDARPRKKRGRPAKISDELKRRALAVQGAKARAEILYGCKYPTSQQKKNVHAILKHFCSKFTPH
jgi:hypothetical protein